MISSALGMLASFIPYEKRVYDVSAGGTYISLKSRIPSDGRADFTSEPSADMIVIEHFADDKQPFSFEQMQRKTTSSSYNGMLMFSKEAPLLKMSISLVPNTKEDIALSNLFNTVLSDEDRVVDICISQERLKDSASNGKWPFGDKQTSEIYNVALYDGVIESGPPGANGRGGAKGLLFSATQDGRLESHTYVLTFSSNVWASMYSYSSKPVRKGFLQSLKDTFTKG